MRTPLPLARIVRVKLLLLPLLAAAVLAGLAWGSGGGGPQALFRALAGIPLDDPVLADIFWKIRLPRVLLAALTGAVLSLGGLVFQALLRNPLAEPYILGISGGAAIGAILGILAGLPRFPWGSLASFAGALGTVGLLVLFASWKTALGKDALLLSGVMINAFCGAVILFLISVTSDVRLFNILSWLMGDLSLAAMEQVVLLAAVTAACAAALFFLSHGMNLLLLGRDAARSLGVPLEALTWGLLTLTSLMVGVSVSLCGLLGFVGLVMPHLMRLLFGPDHRVLVPACVLAGASYMILCDLLARVLPRQGEMPVGVVTALIGAPTFIFLLRRAVR
ncbi:MAG: iron ABC transporter permease [Desulfobacterales bacterium]